MLGIHRWLTRRHTNELCVQAIRTHRAMDTRRASVGTPGYDAEDTCLSLHALHGRLNGIRIAICVLNGWIVDDDSHKDGPADRLILEHWEQKYPETWRARA